jgi:ABC-2 type transport system permease protein
MSATTQEPGRDVEPQALRAALVAGRRPEPPGIVAACLAFGWRGMLKIKHVPEQLLDVTVTPVLFLVMFTYLFGGAVQGSTQAYLQYLLPGMLVQSVLFTSVYSGVTLNTDMTKGVVDRFRTLPVWRAAPLVGGVLGDSVRFLIAGAVVMVVGFVMGFEAASAAGVLAAVLLVALFAFALSWVFAIVGLSLRSPNATMNAGFMALFPLVFLSNIFVSPDTLPPALEAFVSVNPISHLTTATRGLLGDSLDAADLALVLGEAAALTLVFAPLTARRYRRA